MKAISTASFVMSLASDNSTSEESVWHTRSSDRALSMFLRSGSSDGSAPCACIHRTAPDKLRRQFNQAFFKRLLIDDSYNVIGELAEPFETLLSEELRQAATHQAELDLGTAVDQALQERTEPTPQNRGLALAGATASKAPATVHAAQGLKEKTMVGAKGLEPLASAV